MRCILPAISQLPQASVSKRGSVRRYWYENDFFILMQIKLIFIRSFGLCLVLESEFLELSNSLLLTSIKKKRNQSSPKIPKAFSYRKKGITLLRAFKKRRQILLSTSHRPDPSPFPQPYKFPCGLHSCLSYINKYKQIRNLQVRKLY